jgi:hypothetical protein
MNMKRSERELRNARTINKVDNGIKVVPTNGQESTANLFALGAFGARHNLIEIVIDDRKLQIFRRNDGVATHQK